jgi:diacylglycerol kinase (ATP)
MAISKPLLVFIVNPISGGRKKAALIARIPIIMAESGYDCEVWKTLYADHAAILTKEAVEAGAYAVIAVGGDGTMNEVASALMGTSVYLGIVPLGSGNGLVRHLGIPLDPENAIKSFFKAIPTPLDACQCGPHYFFCAAGMGYDAEVALRFNQGGPRGLIRYLWEAVFTYFRYKPKWYTISIDGTEVFSATALMVTLCNASQIGNNAFLAPDAQCDDGLMDVVVLLPFPFWLSLILLYKLFARKLKGNKYLLHFQCKSGIITRPSDEVIHYDGETVIAPAILPISITPAALHILVPSRA